MDQDEKAPELVLTSPNTLTLEGAKAGLASFLAVNPKSSIEEIKIKDDTRIVIKHPWGDPSLRIKIPEEIDDFSNIVNKLVLPERFSGFFHRDTKDLEIIYTAFPLEDDQADMVSRKFVFSFSGAQYLCEFGPCSHALNMIVEHTQPVGPSNTDHRNLMSFFLRRQNKLATSLGKEPMGIKFGDGISFWIRNAALSDADLLRLVSHLNFYMSLYDTSSPIILIHTPVLEGVKANPVIRYRIGSFPDHMDAGILNSILLHFWSASTVGDPARRFLYSYRIIEYISFTYLEMSSRVAVRRLLNSPHARNNVDDTIDAIVAAMAPTKLHDSQKIDAVIQELGDVSMLWKEVDRNNAIFCSDFVFEGGLTIPPLIKAGWKESDFSVNGLSQFAKCVREIRNALAHGRDQKSGGVVLPTPENFHKLQPWAALLAVVSGDVMVNHSRQH